MRGHAVEAIRAGELKLVYVIGTYPSLTKTFVDREILSLRRMGAAVQVVAVRRPTGMLSPEQHELEESTIYLLPATFLPVVAAHLRFAFLRPLQFVSTFLYLLTRSHPGPAARLRTVTHFAAGVYASHLLAGQPCDHIHAHFVDRAATMAMVMSRLLGVGYSVTAHANDIYVSPVLLPEKMSGAKFVATCTQQNKVHLDGVLGNGHGNESGTAKVSCIHHGLDLSRYSPSGAPRSATPVLLAVGQLKEKKGFTHLLQACRLLLDRNYHFECDIVGEGTERPQLETMVRQLSLESTVTLSGALPHQEVIRRYERSHIFVLPCVLGSDGDRDGIPNVVLEAMAMQLPVVSTDLSGIPEVVENDVNGLLVPPGDPLALANAIAGLLDDPILRQRLGERGREKVASEFDADRNARRLLQEFTLCA